MVLGGIVSLGSNVGTLQQTMAAMTDAEALRSDLTAGSIFEWSVTVEYETDLT
jgi:hypothetical protein